MHKDILTQAKEAEAAGDLKEAVRLFTLCMRERQAEVDLINNVQQGLSSRLEMPDIYNLVGDTLRDTFNAQVVMISQYDPLTARVYHHYAVENNQHLHLTEWMPVDVTRRKIITNKKPVMLSSKEILARLRSTGMRVIPGTQTPKTWLGVPMLVGDRAIGIVSLQNLDRTNAFTQSDINLLITLTGSLTLSLENARLMKETQRLLHLLEKEMDFARETQRSILPDVIPQHKGYDIGAMITPARAVSGDFYDFIHLEGNRLGLVIGDVTDKGLPAALYMALTFSLVREEARRTADPGEVAANVNRALLTMNSSGMFVTLIYGVLDYKTGQFSYVRAGHPLPVILNKKGTCLEIPYKTGQPLGIFKDICIDTQSLVVPKGGLLLMHSDGLSEAIDSRGNAVDMDVVKQDMIRLRDLPADEICKSLWREVEQNNRNGLYQDDFTVMVVKREE